MYSVGLKDKRHNQKYGYLLDKNKITKEDNIRFNELEKIRKRRGKPIDGGVLDPEGARYPVRGGDTPVGVPNDMKTYTKQK